MSLLKKITVTGVALAMSFAVAGVAMAATLPGYDTESACTDDGYYWYAGTCYETQAESLNAQIADLTATIQALQDQLGELEGPEGPAECPCTFTKNLYPGMSGDEVKCLQQYLNDSGYTLAESGPGSPGNETTYFGPLTKAAVKAWQDANGVEYGDWAGYFGPKSQAAYDELCAAAPPVCADYTAESDCEDAGCYWYDDACHAEQQVVCTDYTAESDCTAAGCYWYDDACHQAQKPCSDYTEQTACEDADCYWYDDACNAEEQVTPGLTVALSEGTPSAAVIPSGSLYNDILKLDLAAEGSEVTVTGLTVTRGGYVANTDIDGVTVWHNGQQLGNIVSALTAEGEAAVDFGTEDLTIAAGETEVVTVKVDMATGATSGTVNFKVGSSGDVSVADDVTINGTFPIVSNTMTLASGSASLGDVQVSVVSPGGQSSTNAQNSPTLEVGDTEVTVGKFKFTQNDSDEAILIDQVVAYVNGTINEDKDLANWKLLSPQGDVLATADKSVDRYVTFDLDEAYEIPKGNSKTLSVKVDITDGSTHYFGLQIQNYYDLMIKGKTTGAYVKPSGSFPVGVSSSGYFGIKAGSLTVTKNSASPSGSVSPGDTNIVLGKFDLRAAGEKLEIRKMGIYVKDDGSSLTGSVKVKNADTGETYLSLAQTTSNLTDTAAATSGKVANSYRDLSTYITISSGETVTLDVTGSISSTANPGDAYQAAIGKFYAKRYASNDYHTFSASATHQKGNSLTVGTVALSVSKYAAFSGERVAKGESGAQVGSFVLGAGTADDVHVSTVKMRFSTTTGVQNVYLTDSAGTQLGSIVGSPSSNGDTFSTDFNITRNTSELLKVFADVTNSFATNTLTATINQGDISGYGVDSSKTLGTTPSSSEGNVSSNSVDVGSATLTLSRDANAPSSEIITAGESGVVLDKIKFAASFEDITLKKVALQMTTASSGLWTSTTSMPADISKVYLYDGDTKVAEGLISDGVITLTWTGTTIPGDSYKVLTVKADVNDSPGLTSKSVGGVQVQGTSSTSYVTAYDSQGLMAASSINGTKASSYNFLFTDTAPAITTPSGWGGSDANQSGDVGTQKVVGKYTLTNDGPIDLTATSVQINVKLSNVSATTANKVVDFRLYDTAGNQIDTASQEVNGDNTSTTTSFAISSAYGQISAGGSQTYVLKADTGNIEADESNPGQNTALLSTYIGGSKGYSSGDTSAEKEWADANLTYDYTPSGESAKGPLKACDSVTVYGVTLEY